ncbi:hypothetical protein AWJ19_06375 [Paenibacillus sp. DMB5]|nr:hypothetical protein AWJ19_06375 [Paenibacillus sp. DMB5]
MEKVKNQHFVGQFYLKQFANKHKQIYVKDIKSSKSSFLTNIRNVAAKRYFYDIPDDINAMTNKNNQTIEKYLSVQGSTALRNIKRNNCNYRRKK